MLKETYVATRDVMNSKSDRIMRHPVAFNNIRHISKYYAMESRIFMSKRYLCPETGVYRYEKQNLWFTNEMVFDFDFNETECELSNLKIERQLKEGLNKLEKLLGKPKYIIRNRDNYTQWEIDKYFTKDNKINLPKKYGVQVVYELKDSLKSQFKEQVNLYNMARLKITEMVGADLNFRGHMFKNYYSNLFNVETNEVKPLSLREIALAAGIDKELIDKIMSLKPWETLNEELSGIVAKYNRRLVNWYLDLNTFKKNGKAKFKKELNWDLIKTDSRNVTLFNYLCSLTNEEIQNLDYYSIVNSDLFDKCTIQEPMDKKEFYYTVENVLEWRKKGGLEPELYRIKEDQVLSLKFKEINFKFNEYAESLLNKNKNNYIIIDNMIHSGNKKNYTLELESLSNSSPENILANLFLRIGAIDILENIRSLITPNFLEWIKQREELSQFDILNYGLDDMFHLIRSAIYLVHFKVYHTIRKWKREQNKPNSKERELSAREKKNQLRKNWMIPVAKNFKEGDLLKYAVNFKNVYLMLKRNGHLKEDGSPFAVSYYQSLFKIRNYDASLYVKIIKMYIFLQKCINLNRCKYSKNNSQLVYIIIKGFTIDDKVIISNILFQNIINYLINNKFITAHDNTYKYKGLYLNTS